MPDVPGRASRVGVPRRSPLTAWAFGNGGLAYRFSLGALPPPLTFTVQLQCLLGSTIPGGLGPQPGCSRSPTTNAASPALWINL